ncbi:hypothetical protein QZH41_009117, partial [Actinostola sp. cb2023]
MLQNGKLPCFLEGCHLEDIFQRKQSHPCLMKVREGFKQLGIFQIAEKFPIFLHLLRKDESRLLTLRTLQSLLKPNFSQPGTNRRKFEGEIYSVFVKYLREVA